MPKKASNKPELIAGIDLARMFGITRQTLAIYWQEGKVRRDPGTGKYIKSEAIEVLRLITGAEPFDPAAQSSPQREESAPRIDWKTEKVKYDALKAKAEYEITIGDLIDKDQAESLFAEIAIALKDALQNLPATAARLILTLEGEAEIEQFLRKEINQIIGEMSRKIDGLGK